MTAWRNLLKGKFYTAINILGLATGLAIGTLIVIWVLNELSYDRFHKDSKNVYRVLSNLGTGSHRQVWPNSHAPLATFAKKEIPEIRDALRIKGNRDITVLRYKNKQFTEETKCYVDPSFFTVFDFKLLRGKAEQAFDGNYSVILTASTVKTIL